MRFHNDYFKHRPEIGTTRVLSMQHGRFYLAIVRYMGVYGQPHTVTYGVKWSVSW